MPPNEINWLDYVCVLCLLRGQTERAIGGPFVRHHRRLRSHGRDDSDENLVSLHNECHVYVHHNIPEAIRLGLIRK